eukprot:COSAG02_NODE_11935_length_1628_cov_635.321125_4_plen_128_part_00
MRLGKKLKSGLKLGAKIGAGLVGAAGVVGAGLFALGSKGGQVASQAGQNALEDFKSGQGSIANVPTDQLDSLFPVAPKPPVIKKAKPRQESTESIIRRRVNDVPAGFIPPPTGNQNFVGGAIDPRFN